MSYVYQEFQDSIAEQLKAFRQQLNITQWDFAMLFDFAQLTIQKIEAGKTKDKNISRLLDIYMTNPKAALQQMRLTGKKVHRKVRDRVYKYFKAQLV